MRRLLLIPAFLLIGGCLTPLARAEPEPPGPSGDRAERDQAEGDRERGPRLMRDGHRRDRAPRLTDEDAAEILEVIAEVKPDAADELRQLREQDPDRFGREVHQRFPRYRWLLQLKRYAPDMYALRLRDVKLAARSHRLARAYQDAGDDAAAAEVRAQLEAVVADHFELRQNIRRAELERLERHLEQLKAQLAERAAQRGKIIAEQVERLIQRPLRPHGDAHPHDPSAAPGP